MKKNILFLVSFAIIFFTVGCVGPRTGHIGRHYLMATNLNGTVMSQQVGNQPPVVYGQTNFSVTSIPPVARTWREVVTGKRPPGATSPLVVPPFPNAGVTGLTPMAIGGGGAPQATPQQVVPRGNSSAGSNYDRTPSGAPILRGNRGYQGTPRLRGNRVDSGGSGSGASGAFTQVGTGLRSFFLPTIYGGGVGTSYTAVRGVSGQVSFPQTRFERTALAHDTYIHGGVPRSSRLRGTRVKTLNATVAVAGGGQFRSGLTATR